MISITSASTISTLSVPIPVDMQLTRMPRYVPVAVVISRLLRSSSTASQRDATFATRPGSPTSRTYSASSPALQRDVVLTVPGQRCVGPGRLGQAPLLVRGRAGVYAARSLRGRAHPADEPAPAAAPVGLIPPGRLPRSAASSGSVEPKRRPTMTASTRIATPTASSMAASRPVPGCRGEVPIDRCAQRFRRTSRAALLARRRGRARAPHAPHHRPR